MLSSFIKYFILVHSVCATCEVGAKSDKACKASFTSKELIMVQRVATKLNLTLGKRDHPAALEGNKLKLVDGSQPDQQGSLFAMAVSKLEAMTGLDIDRDGSVASEATLEKSERSEQETTENISMAVSELKAINGFDIDRDGSVASKANLEKSERKEQATPENNQAKSREAESRVAEWKEAELEEAKKKEMETKEGSNIKLADVSEVLSKPKYVLEALSSHVHSLEASLSEVQRQGVEAIKAQKATYELTLEAKRRNNTVLAQKNKNTSARISVLKKSNENLRSRAQRLTKQCKSLTSDLKALRANISSAHEFIENALGSSAEELSTAPQLKVLQELAQKDADMEQYRDHQHRLRQVGMAMMQMSVNESKPNVDIDAGAILESLKSDLEELVRTQNASAASLKHAFQKEFQTCEQQHNELLTEERKLNATETAALELKERLTAAAKHLEQTHEALLQESQIVRQYIQRIGSRALQ